MEQLLILGAPGSGKTTLLLELARDLLDRAVRDPTHPIPVVFPLSTWAESRRPLAEWLVEELYQRYDRPPQDRPGVGRGRPDPASSRWAGRGEARASRRLCRGHQRLPQGP